MPSVGMRRTTRVFVPKSVVKDKYVGKVLRSGKRLWSESGHSEPERSVDGDEWFRLLDNSNDAVDTPFSKEKKCRAHEAFAKQEVSVMDFDTEMAVQEHMEDKPGVASVDESEDIFYGTVYQRKRRRLIAHNLLCSTQSDIRVSEDQMYGISFVRKQRRKKLAMFSTEFFSENQISEDRNTEWPMLKENISDADILGHDDFRVVNCQALLVVVESSHSSNFRFIRLLNSILSYMKGWRLRLPELAGFLCSKPISSVFSSQGIHFLHDCSCETSWHNDISKRGICKISGLHGFIPVFSLDYTSVPLSFMYLHISLFIRCSHLPHVFLSYLKDLCTETRRITDSQKSPSSIYREMILSGSKNMSYFNPSLKKKKKARFVLQATEFGGRRGPIRHSVNSRNVQRRRSCMRTRVKNPSRFNNGNADGLIDLYSDQPWHSVRWRRASRKSSEKEVRELKSALVGLKHNIDSVHCYANILVIESDKCYREEGAEVMLECTSSKGWSLAVKFQGILKYNYKTPDVMRPGTSNRYTNAFIWTGDNGWKLEFSDRKNWMIFKELHSECCERNLRATASDKTIPVPSVVEVPDYQDNDFVPFIRPDTYITMQEDEVSRALKNRNANYDIDSGDEEWLEKINNDFHGKQEGGCEYISEKAFQEIIDMFERAAYNDFEDVSDENRAADLCLNLGSRDIVVAVHQYWLRKRKPKRSALVRVFQCHPPRRGQLFQKPTFRKKRSFKRQAVQHGRGKQKSYLQALAAEEEARKKHEEANKYAMESTELAVKKRRRVQSLMEYADLATYRATMALRIAEAAQFMDSMDVVVSSVLD